MMRKTVARLLALVLVLCLAVTLIPASAFAEEIARPEGMTDEEWEAYLLKRKQMAEAVDNSVEVPASPTLPAEPAPTVSVEVPVDTPVSEDGKVVTKGTADGTEETVSIEESYTVEAKITEVEKSGDEVTDITYKISMDKTTEIKDGSGAPVDSAKDENGETVTAGTEKNVDLANNEAAEAAKEPAPQYKVNMSVTGMKDAPTRVEHKYYTPKKTTTSPEAAAVDNTPAETEEHIEYYYNAANGIDETDTSKKYFTVSEVEKEPKTSGVVSTVTEKVVSLWTSFLGIFHITNDAFEGSADANGKKDTYADLSAAADANTGETVEMLRDYETTSTATISNGVTVDLNGNSYTNRSESAAVKVDGTGTTVSIENGYIFSDGDGVKVEGKNNKFSLKNLFLRSNDDEDKASTDAAVRVGGTDNQVTVENSIIDGSDSRYGIQITGGGTKDFLTVTNSDVLGGTGIAIKDAGAEISGSYVAGTAKAVKGTDSGAAVSVEQQVGTTNSVVISSGLFDSAREVENIHATGKTAINSITVKGGRFTDPDDLYCYVAPAHAVISHNDGSYFLYEVVGTDYVPSRDGYRFLGYTDGNGNAISLAEAYRKGVIAYAQWKAIPEKTAKPLTVADLIKVKTDEKDCTIKVTVKGDTAFVTVKDKDGDFAPISEVKAISVKKLQLLKIDTIEVQVDEDVSLVLDIEKPKENGFADTIEVNLEKDTLLITSGEDTCIELDIAVLKASDKPVEIQLVEGELSVRLGKNSTMSVDLTKALKTGERIVVKLENGVLKLYDKYNKPIEE